MRRLGLLGLTALGAACGLPSSDPTPTPITPVSQTATPSEVDSLWDVAGRKFRQGKWSDASTILERLVLEFPPGDSRIPRARLYLGNSYLASKSHLQAVREFRKLSDERPGDPLAPLGLLRAGDAYAELWRRPELDPSYGQTAMATYQELLNRYPESEAATRARARIGALEEKFAIKQYKSAVYYFRLKAYDSAILYLKDLVASYPRTSTAPDALELLVDAYNRLGYEEDVTETCGYLRRFHPSAAQTASACSVEPADS
jgi:outer membrane protein assembly factor BamD